MLTDIERVSERVLEVGYSFSSPKGMAHQLHISDVHFDSRNCDRKLLKSHLEAIKAKNGSIYIYGDWFDVMGAYGDPRSKMQDIRPEYNVPGRAYLDLVIEDSFEFLKPYSDHLVFMGKGNHETNIEKRHDTDPIQRLVYLLQQHGSNVAAGSYTGYIRFRLNYNNNRRATNLQYHHGSGGGAKRSKGMLQNQIKGFMYPDAEIVVSGHDHQKWYDPSNVRERISPNGNVYYDTQHVLKLGSYKSKSPSGMGFEHEKEFMPTRLGGWFVDLEFNKKERVKVHVAEAG